MIIFKTDTKLQEQIKYLKKEGKSIGFVPTMGALHDGHIQLVKEAITTSDICVVSIFVNPTQFSNKQDLANYPVTTDTDIDILEKNGCHILYLPSVEEIYPSNRDYKLNYDIGILENLLEGAFRHGHYKGVVQVVNILLKTVLPNLLFLGAKDYQQCEVLTQFSAKHFPALKVIKVPTVRAQSGLALSSRNKRLTKEEFTIAPTIYASLEKIKNNLKQGDLSNLEKEAKLILSQNGLQPEYVVIADASNLKTIENWDGKTKLVALVAAKLGEVRLIDNLELN